jgi:hypothetical protein
VPVVRRRECKHTAYFKQLTSNIKQLTSKIKVLWRKFEKGKPTEDWGDIESVTDFFLL